MVEIDVGHPQGADPAEPETGADRHAQRVAVGSRQPHGDLALELSLGEGPQLRAGQLHA